MSTQHIKFNHGLGDCVFFAHQLPLYQRRGFEFEVGCQVNKEFLFAPACTTQPDASHVPLPWKHGVGLEKLDDTNHWQANKAMANFSLAPMPDIGPPSTELWDEYCAVKVDLGSRVSPAVQQMVADYFSKLARPIILLHGTGNTSREVKSLSDAMAVEIYRTILDETGGTLLLLDWDNRVPRVAHGRIKHLTDDWKRLSVEELLATIMQADLLVGVDSGPLHLCRFTETPAVGLWLGGQHPARFSLPRANQVNITLKKSAPKGNRYTRWFYNIIEEHADHLRPSLVGRTCRQLLAAPRYLSRGQIGRDVMMQHWVTDLTRGGLSDYRSFIDRDKSFDLMLRHASHFTSPRIVETGCIRAEEDWRGAGFSTYLLGAFAAAHGGRLDSVDKGEKNCAFARHWTRIFGESVGIHCNDSLHYLSTRQESVDLLYLDSWDTYVPGFAEHGLREIQAAEKLLHAQTMVVYDDTSIRAGQWQGKGTLGVPWLLERGWRTMHVGHQTVLVRA
ncbi:class I SAM-dependent methyltransferase [Prosthecobacter sp.]|uniref:class I SAM-dependent methyltransferase n=1 Tax=Prosthecobacter sp. TaxID=1965333 RepID=UPI002ABC95E3|nr:class I SAM-dependent methyltransferase [Prosthecobacter sp.]MDZ4403469.1 glycosyltransferase family 9 protein [Prosthecobacter sp.]